MVWKLILFLLMTFVIIAGIAFPIVPQPTSWYQFPVIPGLEEKAKIIFFHVPTAWLAVIAFLMAMVYGIRYLKNKNLDEDAKSAAALQLGMVFAILATITGSIWAKFTWGAFWHWDPRETSIFILLLIYGSLFALRSAIENEDKRARLSAVYSIIAFLTVPFFIFIITATAHSVNLTDGLDGLAGGTLLAAFTSYGAIAFARGHYDLATFCGVISGALLAFLWYNINPARFFMGDTGSMSLGVTLGVIAMITNSALLLPVIGIIFVIETVSVIMQMFFKKFLGRKLFISSPLHHHLEALGWPEPKIVMRFWVIAAVSAVIGLILFLGDKI